MPKENKDAPGEVAEIDTGKTILQEDTPLEECKAAQTEREDAPDEEEAEHEREADQALEIAGVDATIKSVDAET